MIFDIDAERAADLTAAFAAGEQRGREHADEHILAECVALRVELEKRINRSFRVETALLNLFACASIIGAWGLVAWLLL